jgi:hypothetical protein
MNCALSMDEFNNTKKTLKEENENVMVRLAFESWKITTSNYGYVVCCLVEVLQVP